MPVPPETDLAKVRKYGQAQVPAPCATSYGSKPPSAATRSRSFGCCPLWQTNLTEWSKVRVAQLRYHVSTHEWSLHCADRDDASTTTTIAHQAASTRYSGDRIRPNRHLVELATVSHVTERDPPGSPICHGTHGSQPREPTCSDSSRLTATPTEHNRRWEKVQVRRGSGFSLGPLGTSAMEPGLASVLSTISIGNLGDKEPGKSRRGIAT
jgi:hypothetical protein